MVVKSGSAAQEGGVLPPLRTFANSPEWMRISDAARLVSVSRSTIKRWVESGELSVSRPSPGIVLVSRDSLRSIVEAGA